MIRGSLRYILPRCNSRAFQVHGIDHEARGRPRKLIVSPSHPRATAAPGTSVAAFATDPMNNNLDTNVFSHGNLAVANCRLDLTLGQSFNRRGA